jgi:hypothetical protein
MLSSSLSSACGETTSRDVNAVRVTVLFPDMGSTIANC